MLHTLSTYTVIIIIIYLATTYNESLMDIRFSEKNIA